MLIMHCIQSSQIMLIMHHHYIAKDADSITMSFHSIHQMSTTHESPNRNVVQITDGSDCALRTGFIIFVQAILVDSHHRRFQNAFMIGPHMSDIYFRNATQNRYHVYHLHSINVVATTLMLDITQYTCVVTHNYSYSSQCRCFFD